MCSVRHVFILIIDYISSLDWAGSEPENSAVFMSIIVLRGSIASAKFVQQKRKFSSRFNGNSVDQNGIIVDVHQQMMNYITLHESCKLDMCLIGIEDR